MWQVPPADAHTRQCLEDLVRDQAEQRFARYTARCTAQQAPKAEDTAEQSVFIAAVTAAVSETHAVLLRLQNVLPSSGRFLEQPLFSLPPREVDGAAPAEVQASALSYAAHHGHLHLVRLLVFSGCSVATTDQCTGETPLHTAAEAGNLKLVLFLLSRFADPWARTLHQQTPLRYVFGRKAPQTLDPDRCSIALVLFRVMRHIAVSESVRAETRRASQLSPHLMGLLLDPPEEDLGIAKVKGQALLLREQLGYGTAPEAPDSERERAVFYSGKEWCDSWYANAQLQAANVLREHILLRNSVCRKQEGVRNDAGYEGATPGTPRRQSGAVPVAGGQPLDVWSFVAAEENRMRAKLEQGVRDDEVRVDRIGRTTARLAGRQRLIHAWGGDADCQFSSVAALVLLSRELREPYRNFGTGGIVVDRGAVVHWLVGNKATLAAGVNGKNGLDSAPDSPGVLPQHLTPRAYVTWCRGFLPGNRARPGDQYSLYALAVLHDVTIHVWSYRGTLFDMVVNPSEAATGGPAHIELLEAAPGVYRPVTGGSSSYPPPRFE